MCWKPEERITVMQRQLQSLSQDSLRSRPMMKPFVQPSRYIQKSVQTPSYTVSKATITADNAKGTRGGVNEEQHLPDSSSDEDPPVLELVWEESWEVPLPSSSG
mmetsp:Transcript_4219/g.13201  ORF Transcript_4219/g.13201 Transcript_4219/m.13201 type:complete len:104 (-) Transcript_4219:465-776(-)